MKMTGNGQCFPWFRVLREFSLYGFDGDWRLRE